MAKTFEKIDRFPYEDIFWPELLSVLTKASVPCFSPITPLCRKNLLCKLKCKYYGRYVDDFFIVHAERYFLKELIPQISEYLKDNLKLDLHPNKIYLQPAENGVQFLGATIKPHRTYLKNRTKGNFYKELQKWNLIIENKPENKLSKEELQKFASFINSYLGIARQHNTYKLRKQIILQHMAKPFWKYVYLCNNEKLVVKEKINSKPI